ncbi:3-oxoadipate enol-lactonase [Rhodovibrionaceae bacterium A322]
MNFQKVGPAGNEAVLHYRDEGGASALTLVFSNSLGTDFRIWDVLIGRLKETLGCPIRTICYDKRGHGLSTAPESPYEMADHVGDLEGLLDYLNVSQAVVVGLSVGGMIAQGLAAKRPDLVKGLVLCDTAARIGTVEIWEPRIAAVTAGGIDSISDAILERWFSEDFRANRTDELAGYHAMLTRTPKSGYLGTCYALMNTDYSDSTRNLKMPTLCLVGSEDGSTPPDLVKATADMIDGASFAEIEGIGHLPCLEAPEAVLLLLTDYLTENGFV